MSGATLLPLAFMSGGLARWFSGWSAPPLGISAWGGPEAGRSAAGGGAAVDRGLLALWLGGQCGRHGCAARRLHRLSVLAFWHGCRPGLASYFACV